MDDDLREAIAGVVRDAMRETLSAAGIYSRSPCWRAHRAEHSVVAADAILCLPALAAKDARIAELEGALDPHRLGELIKQASGELGGVREFRPLPEIPGATHSVAVSLPDASPVIDCVKLARLLASPARSTLHSQGEGG